MTPIFFFWKLEHFVQRFGPLLASFFFLNYAIKGAPSTQLNTESVGGPAGDRSPGLWSQARAALAAPATAPNCSPSGPGRGKGEGGSSPSSFPIPTGARLSACLVPHLWPGGDRLSSVQQKGWSPSLAARRVWRASRWRCRLRPGHPD